jgi:hypothetical protein
MVNRMVRYTLLLDTMLDADHFSAEHGFAKFQSPQQIVVHQTIAKFMWACMG